MCWAKHHNEELCGVYVSIHPLSRRYTVAIKLKLLKISVVSVDSFILGTSKFGYFVY